MSDTFTGIVTNLDSKLITSKAGRSFRVHLVELDGGQVINVGFKQPFSIGEGVSIPVEQKFGEWKMLTGAPTGSAPSSSGTTAPPKPAAYGAGRNTKFPIPKDHGDFSIIRQNALTNAVNYFNANKGACSFEAGLEEVIKAAYKFAEFSSGHREERIQRELKVGKAVD